MLDALKQCPNGLVAQPLFETIEQLAKNVKFIEKRIRELVSGDRVVELLMTIPGCGEICAWTIRAYTDEIGRFTSPKRYVSYAGLAPWVQNSNETVRHGRITKRGPKELRTAIVQVVMGMRRMKAKTASWLLMRRHEVMKKVKIPGKAIIATARKIAVIIWNMLSEDAEFDTGKMVDKNLAKKSEDMRNSEMLAGDTVVEPKEKPAEVQPGNKYVKKNGVAGKTNKNGREKRKVG